MLNQEGNTPLSEEFNEILSAEPIKDGLLGSVTVTVQEMPREDQNALFSYRTGRWWHISERKPEDKGLVCVPFAVGSDALAKGDFIIYGPLEKRN